MDINEELQSILQKTTDIFQNENTEIMQTISNIVSIAVTILLIIAWWRLFKKAGITPILSIIPIVNVFFFVKIATGKAWKTLLLLIPIFNVIYAILLNFKLARAFGKGIGFGFGLLFLAPIFELILGLGSAEYHGAR